MLSTLLVAAFLSLLIYVPFLNHVGKNEIGIAYRYSELRNCEIERLQIQNPGSGWHFTNMTICVSYIELDTFHTTLITGETVNYWFNQQKLIEFLKLVPAESLDDGPWDFLHRSTEDLLRDFVVTGTPRSFLGVDTLDTSS